MPCYHAQGDSTDHQIGMWPVEDGEHPDECDECEVGFTDLYMDMDPIGTGLG